MGEVSSCCKKWLVSPLCWGCCRGWTHGMGTLQGMDAQNDCRPHPPPPHNPELCRGRGRQSTDSLALLQSVLLLGARSLS